MGKRGIKHGAAPEGAAMTFEDIGAILGISSHAARRDFFRAIRKIKHQRSDCQMIIRYVRASVDSRKPIIVAHSVECDRDFVGRYAHTD